mgnify:CR=1 FL=1
MAQGVYFECDICGALQKASYLRSVDEHDVPHYGWFAIYRWEKDEYGEPYKKKYVVCGDGCAEKLVHMKRIELEKELEEELR